MTQFHSLGQRLHFYDSSAPDNIPTDSYAAVYVNGFTWPVVQERRMFRVFHVSVEAGAAWAHSARCIDVENGAATPAEAVAFVHERRRLGYDDATVYVNRSNWPTVIRLMAGEGLRQPLYWVATLDGTTTVEPVDGIHAWAVQYQGGVDAPFDRSILYGVSNFVEPR